MGKGKPDPYSKKKMKQTDTATQSALEIHCVLCRTDVGGAALRIKQLVDDHTELRQGVKRLEMEVKVTNFVQKMKVRNTSNKMYPIIFTSLASH
jgi:hypothetical protein